MRLRLGLEREDFAVEVYHDGRGPGPRRQGATEQDVARSRQEPPITREVVGGSACPVMDHAGEQTTLDPAVAEAEDIAVPGDNFLQLTGCPRSRPMAEPGRDGQVAADPGPLSIATTSSRAYRSIPTGSRLGREILPITTSSVRGLELHPILVSSCTGHFCKIFPSRRPSA